MSNRNRAAQLARFDTTTLLRAVDDIDRMREHLDGDGYKPPEIRDDVLRLHQLAMKVVNQGYGSETRTEMFELALDLEERIDHIADELHRLREVIWTCPGKVERHLFSWPPVFRNGRG